MKNLFLENLNYLIIRDFWMLKIWPYFLNPDELQFLFVFQFLCPKKYVFESFTWVIIHVDFVAFLFRIFKLKMTLALLNISSHIDMGRFVSDWTCVIQILE
jgi:hypothetical protein